MRASENPTRNVVIEAKGCTNAWGSLPSLQRHESATEVRQLSKGDCRPTRNWVRLEALWASTIWQLYRRGSYNRGGGGRSMAPMGEFLLLLLSNQLCRMPRASGAHRQVCCRSPGTT